MKSSKLTLFLNLLLEEEDFHKTSYYAEKLMVSSKTISNYINDLRYYMRNHQVALISRHGVGIRLEGSMEERAKLREAIQQDLDETPTSKNRQHKILEKLLMKDECVSVRRLSDAYCVSSTSIVKDLEKIEQHLSQQDLYLQRDKSGTRIIGKEQRIRSAKRKFIFNELMALSQQDKVIDRKTCQAILSRYVDEESQNISRQMIQMAQDKLNFHLDTNYYNQIFVTYAIFISRIRKGYGITEAPARPVVTELHILKTYPITEEITQWLKDAHGITMNDRDIRWVNARIAGVYHEDQKAKDGYSPIVQDIVNELITSIGDIFSVDFMSDELLKTGLSNHFVPMIARLKNNIKISNPFLLQIKQQFTAMFSVISLASSVLEKKLGYTLSDDEIGFILIHFQAALERHNLSKKIAIVYNCNLANALLIENQIKINLPTFDVIELINIQDLKEKYLHDFDFIISTMEVSTDLPSVVISPLADSNDIQKIKQTYDKLIRDVKESRFYSLLQAISSDTILVKQKCKSKEEILKTANDILRKKGYITEDFYQSVLNREKISSTEIGNGIAIPHGLDTFVNHTAIVLITLEEPILWKEDMVRVIFFTAVSFEQKEIMKKLLKDLYHLISANEFIEQISAAETCEEVLGLLYGKRLSK